MVEQLRPVVRLRVHPLELAPRIGSSSAATCSVTRMLPAMDLQGVRASRSASSPNHGHFVSGPRSRGSRHVRILVTRLVEARRRGLLGAGHQAALVEKVSASSSVSSARSGVSRSSCAPLQEALRDAISPRRGRGGTPSARRVGRPVRRSLRADDEHHELVRPRVRHPARSRRLDGAAARPSSTRSSGRSKIARPYGRPPAPRDSAAVPWRPAEDEDVAPNAVIPSPRTCRSRCRARRSDSPSPCARRYHRAHG